MLSELTCAVCPIRTTADGICLQVPSCSQKLPLCVYVCVFLSLSRSLIFSLSLSPSLSLSHGLSLSLSLFYTHKHIRLSLAAARLFASVSNELSKMKMVVIFL